MTPDSKDWVIFEHYPMKTNIMLFFDIEKKKEPDLDYGFEERLLNWADDQGGI